MPHPSTDPEIRPVALVTGAGGRIGAAIAEHLARAGYAVIVHYRGGAEGAQTVVARIRTEGGRAAAVRADLTDRTARAGLVPESARLFGPLTLLVNNASLFEPDSARDLDEALWDAHFALHVEAPCFLARDFAAQLPEGADGAIVNIIDERVLALSPGHFSYTLSKSALWTATTLLAQSLAPAIRVNAVGPGPVLPAAGQDAARFAASVNALPLGRHAGPEAIAEAVLFLAAAPAITGQMLALDGGRHIEFPARRGPTPRR